MIAEVLDPRELADFGDSLVFDERSGICFAYDPRDEGRRRLNVVTCGELNCFDCSFTASRCHWEKENKRCRGPRTTDENPPDNARWWQWFIQCEDELGMCKGNGHSEKLLQSQDEIKSALDNEEQLGFAIVRPSNVRSIPRNYFCAWSLDISPENEYQL